MKLIKPKVKTKNTTKQTAEKTSKRLPPDSYAPIFDPSDVEVDENRKFVVTVTRAGDDGLPVCDIRTYQTTEAYTGFTRKGINLPVNILPELIETLKEVNKECEKKNLHKEYE